MCGLKLFLDLQRQDEAVQSLFLVTLTNSQKAQIPVRLETGGLPWPWWKAEQEDLEAAWDLTPEAAVLSV